LAAKIVTASGHQASAWHSLHQPAERRPAEGRSLPMNAYGRAMRHKYIYIMKS